MTKKRVMVGMSGGVDSSVAAYLLKNLGYEIIGVTIKLWDNFEIKTCEKVCCSIDDVYDAKKVCDLLEIPHYTVNFRDEFGKAVVDEFISGYNSGITPSPCIICNEKIKFGKLLEFAEKTGCDYIATGHYVTKGFLNGTEMIMSGLDYKKDQSYMLYRLNEYQISRSLFPLGNLTKPEVREIARNINLPVHEKRDSQGICFVMGDYKRFLKESLGSSVKEGFFTDINGRIIGRHEGYQLYTIGQRRGLGLNHGFPYFIIDIIPSENRIILGEYSSLMEKEIFIKNAVFHTEIAEGTRLLARPRFSSKGEYGSISYKNDCISFIYDNENTLNAPGQHVVFYQDNYVVGGGEIKRKK